MCYEQMAGIWLWITPATVAVALLLACAAWLWITRLLPLVSIPAALGMVLLTAFVLTGDQWDYYKSNGYWLAVLGPLMVLINGLWTRWNTRENETLPAALAWHALMGGGLIFLGFFLPWLLLRTPFLPYRLNQLPPYQGAPITGMSLADGSFAFLPPAYPRIAPQGYWLLWLVPLIGLLGAGTAWMSLRGQRISRWFWMLISLVPLPIYLFLLRPAVQEGVVRIWDTTSGQTLFSYRGHQQDTIRGLSWSSRGNAIASSSLGSIRVWQPEYDGTGQAAFPT